MNKLFVPLTILLIVAFIISGCSTVSTAPSTSVILGTSTTSAAINSSATVSPSTTAEAAPIASASPTATTSNLTPQYGGTLTIIVPSGTLNAPIGSPSEQAQGGLYDVVTVPTIEDLIHHDNQYSIVPKLAESLDVAPDGKSFTFNLRPGIQFQDGTPLNAQAVEYNIENYAPLGVKPSYLKTITSFDIIDDYTLRLNLSNFDLNLLMSFVSGPGAIDSPKAMQIPTTSSTSPGVLAQDHVVGTGAFKLISYQPNDSLEFAKVDNYWQKGKPYLDGIKFVEVADPFTAETAFKSGLGQFLYRITPLIAHDLAADGYQIIREQLNPIGYITPDGRNPDSPFHDIRVREAAEYAIDRTAIAQTLGMGYYPPATQFALPGDPQYNAGLGRDYDPNKAKQLLAEAGYPTGFKTNLFADNTTDTNVLAVLQSYLKVVGINAQIQIMEPGALMNLAHNGWHNGILVNHFPINAGLATKISMFFSPDLSQGPLVMASEFVPDGWGSQLAATLAEPDIAQRTALTKSLAKMMYDSAMAIPLWSAPELSAEDNNVHGLNWGVGHGHFWDPESAWLSK